MHIIVNLRFMSNKNLSDEIMSNLQLQKEYICLDLEDKALRLVFIFLIGLSITLCCTGLLYHFFGYLVAWIFIVVILINKSHNQITAPRRQVFLCNESIN